MATFKFRWNLQSQIGRANIYPILLISAVEVWLEYLQFITQFATEDGGIEQIRNTFEKALTAAGLHVMKGSLIWDAFREFEKVVLMVLVIFNCSFYLFIKKMHIHV